jgi:hypothetical protein
MNKTDNFNWNTFNMAASITVTVISLIGNSLVFFILSKPEFNHYFDIF